MPDRAPSKNSTVGGLADRVQRTIDTNRAEVERIESSPRRELTETFEQLATDRQTIKVTKERVEQTEARLGHEAADGKTET